MSGDPQPRRRGNVLLAAIVLVTLLSLLMAMAVQPIRTAGQRMKERELIYRGEHIAAAIRRFYLDKGRFPFELEELVEGDYRYARQLYADPMSEDGDWTLVYLTPADLNATRLLNASARRLLGAEETELNSENLDERTPGLSGSQDSAFSLKRRQITGIRSKSSVEGLAIRQDSRIYSDWLFTALPNPGRNIEDMLRALPNQPQKNFDRQ